MHAEGPAAPAPIETATRCAAERGDVLGLEERGFSAWPAPQTVYFGGWVFRLGGGFTKRANSANALGSRQDLRSDSVNALTPNRDFSQIRAEAERLYDSKGLPTIFRLTPIAGADAELELAKAGYRALDPHKVMSVALQAMAPVADVRLDPGPTPAWLNGVTAANGVAPSHRAIHDLIIKSIALPAVFATWTLGKQPLGYGMAVLDRGAVGLFDVVVHPGARGRGGGRKLTQALMSWGHANGAAWCYLQVVEANAVARGLYQSAGFTDVYQYHYRRRDVGASAA